MDKDGHTALRQAASFGGVDVEKLLLRYGADVNAQDANGETVLYAIEGRKSTDPATVALLKQAGAKE